MKRLNYSLTRGSDGTNHSVGAHINTNGRPATTNFLFYGTEAENNTALKEWNNPRPIWQSILDRVITRMVSMKELKSYEQVFNI